MLRSPLRRTGNEMPYPPRSCCYGLGEGPRVAAAAAPLPPCRCFGQRCGLGGGWGGWCWPSPGQFASAPRCCAEAGLPPKGRASIPLYAAPLQVSNAIEEHPRRHEGVGPGW
ncbi:MAG: hypothetical protein IKI28_08305 [Bacteroidales bacterium]|nr:hypothetical protein [Bacteroidales bacterium]